jgi:hypothetical protein
MTVIAREGDRVEGHLLNLLSCMTLSLTEMSFTGIF